MGWIDEICVSCGVCCTTVSIVRITAEDIDRLMRGYGLTPEQAQAMLRRDTSEFRILMDQTAACPALSSNAGRYICHAYEHRPGICREYECYILASAKDWLRQRSLGEKVDNNNPFHCAQDEEELARQVRTSVERLRANYLHLCVKHQNDDGFRKPDYLHQLVKTLSGADFQNTFPPNSGARTNGLGTEITPSIGGIPDPSTARRENAL